MTVADLLQTVRARHGLPSNYALARLLGVRENDVWRWHSGRHTPDNGTSARLAEMAGLDPDVVVAQMQALRASDDAERTRWQRIAARLEAAAAAMISTTGGPDAGASTASADARENPLCIMSTRLFVAAARALRPVAASTPAPLAA